MPAVVWAQEARATFRGTGHPAGAPRNCAPSYGAQNMFTFQSGEESKNEATSTSAHIGVSLLTEQDHAGTAEPRLGPRAPAAAASWACARAPADTNTSSRAFPFRHSNTRQPSPPLCPCRYFSLAARSPAFNAASRPCSPVPGPNAACAEARPLTNSPHSLSFSFLQLLQRR